MPVTSPSTVPTPVSDEPQIIKTGPDDPGDGPKVAAPITIPATPINFYPVRMLRRSSNNKVFLLICDASPVPRIGKVMMVLKDKKPLMGFRVIKLYPGQKYFAVKRIKSYVERHFLNSEEPLLAMEKYLDSTVLTDGEIAESSPLSKAAQAEEEKEPEIKEYDPDLDVANSPKPKAPADPDDAPPPSGAKSKAGDSEKDPNSDEDSEDEDVSDELEKLMVDQPSPIELHHNWISAGLAYLRGVNADGQPYYFSTGSLRYGLNLGRRVFVKSSKVQDSLTLETGFYLYKAINFAADGDAYTVLSVPGTLRYNLMYGENFGIFLYGGVLQGLVLSATASTDAALGALGATQIAAGGGLLFQLGPSWYTRLDLGIDNVGMALVLRF